MGLSQDKGPRGVDEGFCFSYHHLSYRRKFIRTLWIMLSTPVILFVPVHLPHRSIWFAATLVVGILQAIYNYWKWQTEEKP